MTPRDFCYWLQGYFEIKRPKGAPLIGEWNTIIEHLTLTITTKGRSGVIFDSFADNLWGFVQFNGRGVPTDDQWKSVWNRLNRIFVKVTTESNGMDDEEFQKGWRRVVDRFAESEHPLPSSDLDLTPICAAEPPGNKLCGGDAYCMTGAIAAGPYPVHEDDHLGRDPLK